MPEEKINLEERARQVKAIRDKISDMAIPRAAWDILKNASIGRALRNYDILVQNKHGEVEVVFSEHGGKKRVRSYTRKEIEENEKYKDLIRPPANPKNDQGSEGALKISANYVDMCKGVHGLPFRLFSAHLVKKRDRVHVPKYNSEGDAWVVSECKWDDVYFEGISRAIKASKGEYFWLPTVNDLKAMCEAQRLRIKGIEDPRNVIGWEHAARFATPEEGWLAYLMKCGTANKIWKAGKWMG